MCGEPLKKGSTACSCGYKESLADRELLRRLARWDRMRTVCSVMLVLGLVMGMLTSVTLRAILPALGRLGYNIQENRKG